MSIVKVYGAGVNTGVKENREFCFRKMKQFAERAKFFAMSEYSAAENDKKISDVIEEALTLKLQNVKTL